MSLCCVKCYEPTDYFWANTDFSRELVASKDSLNVLITRMELTSSAVLRTRKRGWYISASYGGTPRLLNADVLSMK